MSVTQVLMGPGNWSVSFTDRLPQSVRDQILPLDHVVIGPAGLLEMVTADADRLAAVDAANGYVGVILEIPDGFTLSGQDLSWWLGDSAGRGPLVDTAIVRTSSATTTTWLGDFLPVNGISTGSVTNGTSFTGVTSPMATRLELLNWVCEQSDVEWQIRPDGTVDVAPSTTLFPAPSATSATVITKDTAGDEGGLSGVEAVDLDRARDAAGVVSRVVVLHSADADEVKFATATTTPTGVRWKDFDGSTPTARSLRASNGSIKAAQASTVATRMISRLSVDQKEALLTSRTHNVTAEVLPGARVWVHDVESGLYDTSNQVTWRGELIQPLQMRVHALTWPVARGLGVYARTDGGTTWVDLTPYVAFEDADVAWEVTISGRKRNRSPVSTGVVSVNMDGSASRSLGFAGDAGRSTTSARVGSTTPTWTNLTIGTGGSPANVWTWSVNGGVMTLQVRAVLGNTGSVGGEIKLTIPTGWTIRRANSDHQPVYGLWRGTVAATRDGGYVEWESSTQVALKATDWAATSATSPRTWAAGDTINIDVQLPVDPA